MLEDIVAGALRDYAHRAAEHANAANAFTAAVSAMSTAMLTWIFFGAEPGTSVQRRFLAHFRELGPYGLVWNPQKRQEIAFRAFFDDVDTEVEAMRAGAPERCRVPACSHAWWKRSLSTRRCSGTSSTKPRWVART